MAFPDEPLPLIVEAVFGGDTVDLSDRLLSDTVSITRGKAAGARQVSTGSCKLVLDDSDGALTPLNPTGDYYPHVRRGVEVRVRLPEAPGSGAAGAASASAVAPSLGVVDGPALLVCAWLVFDDGTPTNFNLTVPGAMVAGPEADDGSFGGSVAASQTVGAGATGTRTATASPTPDGWMAISVAVPGTVTVAERLSDAAVAADVTLTTSATPANGWLLAIQGWDLSDNSPPRPSGDGWMLLGEADGVGRMRAWLKPLYDRSPQSVTFGASPASVDNHAHLLVLSGVRAMVLPTDSAPRFTGTVSSYRPRLVPTTDGVRAVQQIDVAGPLRRLEKGQPPLESPLRRQALSAQNAASLKAYWPCEDGSEATQIAAGLPGVQPMRITGDRNFAADSTSFPGSAPLLRLANNTALAANIPTHAGTGTVAYRGLFAFPPGGLTDGTVILDLWQAVTNVRRWRITYHTGGLLQLWAIGPGGAVLAQTGLIGFAVNGTASMLGFAVVQEGGNAHWHIFTRHVAGGQVVQGGLDGTFPGQPVNVAAELYINPFGGLTDVTTGHHLVGTDLNLASDIQAALTGYAGERAGTRFLRLAVTENGVAASVAGNVQDTTPMGPQGVDTLPNLLHETAAADGAVLGEARTSTDLVFRTRTDMYNQVPAVMVDLATYRTTAGTSAGVLAPVYDVTGLVNAFTAERKGGSSEIAVDDTSIAEDGLFEDRDEYNVYTDDLLPDIAGWAVHLGTVDEYRNPALALDLGANPQLIPQWAAVELGDRIQRLNPPAPHPPGGIDQILDGYSETIGPKRWEISANMQPGGPWGVAEVFNPGAEHGSLARVAGEQDMVLAQAIDDNDTAILVTSLSGQQRWCTPTDDGESAADFPHDVTVGGERMTVSDVDPGASDGFGRTVAGGWGTPDTSGTGAVWAVTHPADSSVTSGEGRFAQPSTATLRTATLDIGAANAEISVETILTVANATGAPWTKWIGLRCADLSNYYVAQLILNTSGQVQLTVIKRVTGALTSLDQGGSLVTAGVNTAMDRWRITFKAAGPDLVATATNLTSGGSARVGGHDDDLSAGNLLLLGDRLEAGNGNVVTGRWDNLTVTTPQILTVTRSVNGVVKSHDPAAVIDVADPAYVAR